MSILTGFLKFIGLKRAEDKGLMAEIPVNLTMVPPEPPPVKEECINEFQENRKQLIGRPVIAVPNEWMEMFVGICMDVQITESDIIYFVDDELSGDTVAIKNTVYPFRPATLIALSRLDPRDRSVMSVGYIDDYPPFQYTDPDEVQLLELMDIFDILVEERFMTLITSDSVMNRYPHPSMARVLCLQTAAWCISMVRSRYDDIFTADELAQWEGTNTLKQIKATDKDIMVLETYIRQLNVSQLLEGNPALFKVLKNNIAKIENLHLVLMKYEEDVENLESEIAPIHYHEMSSTTVH